MTLTKADFAKLRGALLLFVILVAAGAATVYFTLEEQKRATLARAKAIDLRSKAETRLRLVSSEEQEIKQKSAQFQQMIDRGIVGIENRLDWVELLRETRDRNRLFEFGYEITPQEKLASVPPGYDFNSSLMKIDLPLLHEGDLLHLLDDIQRDARALVIPRECRLTRMPPRPPGSDQRGPAANLRAACTLQWITVRAPEKKS